MAITYAVSAQVSAYTVYTIISNAQAQAWIKRTYPGNSGLNLLAGMLGTSSSTGGSYSSRMTLNNNQNITDLNSGTYASNTSDLAPGGTYSAYVTYDFITPVTLENVTIDYYRALSRTQVLSWQYSINGSSYTTVGSEACSETLGTIAQKVFTFTPVTARYWRFNYTFTVPGGANPVGEYRVYNISTVSFGLPNPTFALARPWIQATYSKFAQARPKIKVIDNTSFSQAQTHIIPWPSTHVHAQAEGYIFYLQSSLAQAQANILQTTYSVSQSAAQITSPIRNSFAQARAVIQFTAVTHIAIRAIVSVTPEVRLTHQIIRVLVNRATYKSAQSSALILAASKLVVAQANAQIYATITVDAVGQAQAKVNAFGVINTAQVNASILAPAQGYAQASVWMRFFGGFSQVQAQILRTEVGVSQANALIESKVKNVYAQAGSALEATSISGFNLRVLTSIAPYIHITQHNLRVLVNRATYTVGQAQAEILANTLTYSAQAQAYINQTKDIVVTAQAAAQIFSFKNNRYAQAGGSIKGATTKSAQATVWIKFYGGWAQARAHIKQENTVVVASTNALISSPVKNAYAYSQASLEHIGVPAFGVRVLASVAPDVRISQASIRVLVNRWNIKSAQANAKIGSPISNIYGQAQGQVKTAYTKSGSAQASMHAYGVIVVGQVQASILKLAGYGNAQGYMKAFDQPQFAQAVAYSLGMTFTHGYARADILKRAGYGQAEASIKITYRKHALARTYIYIIRRGYAQSIADIKDRNVSSGMAQSYIIYKSFPIANAQASILPAKFAWGLAAAYISGQQFANVQASIKTYSIAVSFTQGFIINRVYPVIYNKYVLPGYAKQETISDSNRLKIFDAGNFWEPSAYYLGSNNKNISLSFTVFGDSFENLKREINRASTIVMSVRSYNKLYLQRSDRYYLAIPKKFSINTEARSRYLEYSVDFEAQPWLYGDSINTITGTTSLVTTGRTLADGVATPATVKVSGTDITVSGYTSTDSCVGYFATSGSVSNLIINSEEYSATIDGVNRNDIMRNLDYQIFVGQGITYFDITGASSAEVSWRNRW